jgi:hypothetical protein
MQELSPQALTLLRRLDPEGHPGWMYPYLRPLYRSALSVAMIVPDSPELIAALETYCAVHDRVIGQLEKYMEDQ